MTARILDILAPRRGKRAVVLCDGPRPADELLASCLDDDDLFICTDAAGRPYSGLPRPPDIVIGDFDTLGSHPADDDVTRFVHDEAQNTTDSEKALNHASLEGCVDAVLLGALGGLIDHTLANAALPERFSWLLSVVLATDRDITIRMSAGDRAAWLLPEGSILSLNPIGPGARGVSLQGVRWPLTGADLPWAGPSTISNHVVAPEVTLSVSGGSLLASVRRDVPT